MTQFPWVQTSTEQAAALDAVVGTLRGAGASVTAVELPHAMHDANVVHRKIMLREGADQLGALQVAERARMSDVLNAALDEGRAIGDEPYRAALTQRTAMIVTASDWLSGFDALVSPPVPGPAPAGLTRTGDPSCCTLWSLLGFPAITLPVALNPQGLPMGMQLAASAGADDRLLAVAQWCEQRLAFKGLT